MDILKMGYSKKTEFNQKGLDDAVKFMAEKNMKLVQKGGHEIIMGGD